MFCDNTVIDQLSREFGRPVFVEPKDALESEKIWNDYSICAQSQNGALLFCVMGGKMSEGINFSDSIARSVIVVGMPFPDFRDPILQEKLQNAERLTPNSSKEMYEAMCMKVVNQSIGRSIRHVNDYASIVLIDKRYNDEKIRNLLPSWISSSISENSSSFYIFKEKLTKFHDSRTVYENSSIT
jgi:chromosome transmission fidelity protein 1